MASYEDWNRALASYFTTGVPRGTKLYLSVDEDRLEMVGRDFGLELTAANWEEDFQKAVRKKVIIDDRVDLQHLLWFGSNSFPPGVAFLGLCVLAADRMADEEQISEKNYFRRLQEILGLSGVGRPRGMESGVEEPLWQNWNQWLMANGFLPTAQRGRGGPTTYINYPISQTLLRRTDKDRLRRLFAEKSWSAQWDDMTLLAYVRREASGLSKYLKERLESRERYEAIAEAIHEVYLQWQDEGCPPPGERTATSSSSPRHLFAGLYRTEDPFLGQVDYYIYPKQLRGRKLESVQVQLGEEVHQLREERPGWYFPLDYAINQSELERGAQYPILDSGDLRDLILPQRDFWVLIPDPDNPESGAYATWGTLPLGTQFILLCKRELLSDLDRLRDERLLEWSGEPQEVFPSSSWVELHQCQVISQAWDAVFISNSALKYTLQPTVRLYISLSGGLRVPEMMAWLEGHGPKVTVFGFSPTAELRVTTLLNNNPIRESHEKTNTPISVNFTAAGDYLIEVNCGGEVGQRIVKIVEWRRLTVQEPKQRQMVPVGSGNEICGAIIQVAEPN